MRIIECEQGSDLWWEAKRGVPSASNFDRILTAKTMKPSAQQEDYIAELIGDLVCQTPNYFTTQGRPVNTHAMQNGAALEPQARRYYEMEREVEVRQVGFCVSDCGRYGFSPDGLVGDDGGLELKAPMAKTQARYLMNGGLPDEYKLQCHGPLAIEPKLKFWDFLSYAPGLPPLLVRVEPDGFTTALRAALDAFHVKYLDALKRVSPELWATKSWELELLSFTTAEQFNLAVPLVAAQAPERAKPRIRELFLEAAKRCGLVVSKGVFVEAVA